MSTTQIFPALDKATEAALRASIERFGVLVPVVVDHRGQILDGHHRVRLAGELGVGYDLRVREVVDDAEAREIARTLNADRRHLTIEQRREVVKALREEGHSLRAIGGALKVDPMTVKRDLGSGVADSTPDEVRGLDGKTYPAKRESDPEPQRRGTRKNRDAPWELKTTRHEELARGQKGRLIAGLSEINGLCRGLKDVDIRMAAAVCTHEELSALTARAGEIYAALRRLKNDLTEVKSDAR